MLDKTVLAASFTTERSKTTAAIQLARKTAASPAEAPVYQYFDVTLKQWIFPPSQDGRGEGDVRAILFGSGPSAKAEIQFWLGGYWVRHVGITEVINSATGKEWDGNQFF